MFDAIQLHTNTTSHKHIRQWISKYS